MPGVTNSAQVTTPGDLDASNDRDTDATTVQGVPDLTLEKRHVNRFEVGYPGTYTFVTHNQGTAATSGATTITDTLPAGLAFTSGAGAGWNFSASGQVVTATLAAPIAAGDSSTFTLDVDVASQLRG